jgi:imidazolonepropionase-like amidohydrolase
MRYILVFINILFFLTSTFAQRAYLHCGTVLDMVSETPRQQITIVVDSGKIKNIAAGYLPAPAGTETIDLKNKTVLPGIIDCHVHLEMEQNPNLYNEKYLLSDADIAFKATAYARRTLMTGITTVRDLGGRGPNLAIRKAIEDGLVVGPRVLSAGRALSVTGGHGDPTNGARDNLFDPPTPEFGVADGPDECRKAVREQIQRGADWIKVCATGGVTSLVRDGRLPHYSLEELQTIVKTARDFGVDVAAHAHGDEGMRRAVDAGVRSIEHGTFMSTTTMDAMIEKGTWYVPTLTAGWAVTDTANNNVRFFPAVVRAKALGIGPGISGTLTKAYKRGVKIAFGTDAGVFPHGSNGLEFEFMANAGVPPAAILRSATISAAEMLRLERQLGTIETGKWADLIAVDENPLNNIKTMKKVAFVMKGGVVYKK